MWVGDRALGGGLDTHRSQVGGEEMGGEAPTRQRESSPTQTDTSGYKEWELGRKSQEQEIQLGLVAGGASPLASSPPEPPRAPGPAATAFAPAAEQGPGFLQPLPEEA